MNTPEVSDGNMLAMNGHAVYQSASDNFADVNGYAGATMLILTVQNEHDVSTTIIYISMHKCTVNLKICVMYSLST